MIGRMLLALVLSLAFQTLAEGEAMRAAVLSGRVEAVKAVLARGVSVDARDGAGRTGLIVAAT